MKKFITTFALLCTLLPSACAPIQWTGPAGVTQASFNRDNYQCTIEAEGAAGMGLASSNIYIQAGSYSKASRLYEMCMGSKGYTKS